MRSAPYVLITLFFLGTADCFAQNHATMTSAGTKEAKPIDLAGDWSRKPDPDRPNLPGTYNSVYRIRVTGRNANALLIDEIDLSTDRKVAEMAPSIRCERVDGKLNEYQVLLEGDPKFIVAQNDSMFQMAGHTWYRRGTRMP